MVELGQLLVLIDSRPQCEVFRLDSVGDPYLANSTLVGANGPDFPARAMHFHV